jgi:hypothetical protein
MSNLTNQYIDESFQSLVQISGSNLTDGTGSLISSLDLAVSTALTATSASHALNADNSVSASYALTASFALNVTDPTWDEIQNKPAGLVSGSSQVVIGDTTGNLLGVRISGPVTDAVNAVSASIANTANSAIIALSASHATNADTSISSSHALVADSAGTATSVEWNGVSNKPSGLVSGSSQIDLSQATGVATNALTASKVTDTNIAYKNENNTFTGTQTFDNIAVNGTGSFAYIQSITGSAKIIGDAFIILNNATPAERYAGIVVQDSGSGSPLTTASLEFDGQSNDWFYEYSDDGGVTTDHGVALFGPEYPTKGTPTYPTNNTIQKGNGGHHLLDSIMTDDGSTVSIADGELRVKNLSPIPSNVFSAGGAVTNYFQVSNEALQGFTGKGVVLAGGLQIDGGFTAINGNNDITGNLTVTGSAIISGSLQVTGGITGDLTGNASTATSASHALNADNLTPGSKTLAGSIKQTFAAPGTDTQIDLFEITGATGGPTNTPYNVFSIGIQDYPGYGNSYKDSLVIEKFDSFGYNYGSDFTLSGAAVSFGCNGRLGGLGIMRCNDLDDGKVQTLVRGNQAIIYANGVGGYTDQFYDHPTSGRDAQIVLREYNTDTSQTEIAINGDNIGIGNLTYQSAGSGSIIIGNNTTTQQVEITGDQIKLYGDTLQSEGRSRSHVDAITVVGAGTSTMDCSVGNIFTVALNASTTLTATNIVAGQTISVRVVNGGTNTMAFDTMFEFAGGTAPTITENGTDILTFISFDGTTLYSTAVQNLS